MKLYCIVCGKECNGKRCRECNKGHLSKIRLKQFEDIEYRRKYSRPKYLPEDVVNKLREKMNI